MNKRKKILMIVGVVLIVLLLASFLICYHFWPEQTKTYVMTFWDWLNKPLPVVGVSTLFICFLVWRIFKATSFGKKQINLFKTQAEETQHKFDCLKSEYETEIKDLKMIIDGYRTELNQYREGGAEVCKTIPNKKVKELGVKYYGEERKETIINETNPSEE